MGVKPKKPARRRNGPSGGGETPTDRLFLITNYLQKEIIQLKADLLLLTNQVNYLISEKVAQDEARNKAIISCDASMINIADEKHSAVGVVIRIPDQKPIEISCFVPSTDNNAAELDAIYIGIRDFLNLFKFRYSNELTHIEIRSDSKLAIELINSIQTTSNEQLNKKVNSIKEQVQIYTELSGKPIVFTWKERNSTYDLVQCNKMAQALLDVKNRK